MKRHAVVTGGAGFLGSHLCDRLLAEGLRVTAVDNLVTGDTRNIAHLLGNENFRFIKHDVTEYIYIDGEVHFILHFASPASPIDYLKLPIQTLKVGSLGTHKALGLAKAKNARFLLASTSEVYGDPLVHPQPESYWGNVNPVGTRGVYDEAKRFAEAMTMAYHRYHRVDTRIVRIFNTYGPRMRIEDGRAIPAFVSQALRGEDVTVFGNGTQTRSVCYVDDLIDGIFKLLASNEVHPVNIGNQDEITMLQLAKEVIELTGSKSQIVFRELPEDDPKIRQPDTTRGKSILGWQARVGRREGLLKTIEYFRSRMAMATGNVLIATMLFMSTMRAEEDSTRSVVLSDDVANAPSATSSLHPVRFAIVTGGVAATIATIHIYQANGWWKGNSSSFHFQEDLTYGRSVDKLGHFYAGAVAAFILRESYSWAGLSDEAALYWGSGGSFLFQTYIEVTDGFHKWGFDRVDFAANVAGAAWPIAQYHSSFLRNFDFKFSYHPSQVLDESCGIGFQGQKHIIFDDYEGQTLWLSAKVKNMLPESWKFWPSPLQLSLGYRVRDMCPPPGSNRKPYSAFLLALDLDMTKVIPNDTPFLRLLGRALNFIKFPMPAVQISPNAIWYGLYF